MKKNILAISIAWLVLSLVIGAVIIAVPKKANTTNKSVTKQERGAKVLPPVHKVSPSQQTSDSKVTTKLHVKGTKPGGTNQSGTVNTAVKVK